MALFTLGILLFLLIAADIIKTTLSTRGGGMLTNAVTRSVWSLFFRAAGRQGRSGVLQYAGQFVVLSVLLSWILGLWASLFLLFASHPGSIVDDATKLPADLWETFYYAGFTLSTLGVGDYAAAADGWRVLTSAAAFCGLTFITAAITYIVPVLSAVSLQNQLSLLGQQHGPDAAGNPGQQLEWCGFLQFLRQRPGAAADAGPAHPQPSCVPGDPVLSQLRCRQERGAGGGYAQ